MHLCKQRKKRVEEGVLKFIYTSPYPPNSHDKACIQYLKSVLKVVSSTG